VIDETARVNRRTSGLAMKSRLVRTQPQSDGFALLTRLHGDCQKEHNAMPNFNHRIFDVRNLTVTSALAVALMLPVGGAGAAEPTTRQEAFRQIYQELIEINTTDSVGDTVKAAEAMAAHLSLALANFQRAHRLRGTWNIGSFSTIS
jgi:hypothetical protein